MNLKENISIHYWSIDHVKKEGLPPSDTFSKSIVFRKHLITLVHNSHVFVLFVNGFWLLYVLNTPS